MIVDRHTYDELLPPRQHLSRFKQWRRWLLAHACLAPDLVLLLDAPGDVLFARKGEYNGAVMEEHGRDELITAHIANLGLEPSYMEIN